MNAEEVFLIKAAAKVFLALCPHGLLRRGRGGEAVDVGAGQHQLLVPQLGPVARASKPRFEVKELKSERLMASKS